MIFHRIGKNVFIFEKGVSDEYFICRYMRICGLVSETMHNERNIFETFPSKELQDYWSNRPKYQDVPAHSSVSGSTSSGTGSSGQRGKPEDAEQSYQEWLDMQSHGKEEVAPPPYSLEAEATPTTAVLAALTVAHNTIPAAAGSNTTSVAQHTGSPSAAPQAVNNDPLRGPSNSNITVTSPTTTTAPHSHSHNTTPPTLNVLTYPGQQTHGPGSSGAVPSVADPQMASLVNDFEHSTRLASPQPHAGRHDPSSPHFAHAAASSSGRYGGNRLDANFGTIPDLSSASGRPLSHQGYSSSPPPQQPPQTSTPGSWSQAQWPPVEWKATNTNVPYAPYRGGKAGANLARPHTVSGPHSSSPSGGSAGANLKPNATICGSNPTSQGRHHYGHPSPGPSFPSGPQDIGSTAPSFPTHEGGFGSGGGSPYLPPAPNVSTYPGQRPTSPYPPSMSPGTGPPTPSMHTTTYPSQQSYYPYAPHHTSPPHSPPGVPSPYPSPPTANYTPYNSHPSQAMPPPHIPGMQFPQGPYGGYDQSGGPTGGMPHTGGYAGGYYPSQGQYTQHGNNHYHGGPGFPQADGRVPGPGSWMPTPGGPSSPPSSPYPAPPRKCRLFTLIFRCIDCFI